MLKKFAIISVILMVCTLASGQTIKPEIRVIIDGKMDSLLYLAKYYGEKTYMVDTAFKKKNRYIFTADSLYPQGLYMFVDQSRRRLMDFLMTSDQVFEISADSANYSALAKVTGNEELATFFEYYKELGNKQQLKKEITEQFNEHKDNADSLEMLRNKMKDLDSLVRKTEEEMIRKHQGSFFSVFLKASQEVLLPDSLVKSKLPDRDRRAYRYMKEHYFDNLSFKDERLLNTPFFYTRVESFLDKMIVPSPDSICAAIDYMLGMTGKSGPVFKFLIWKLTYKYESSNIMGYDKVFVHIIDNYFSTGLVNWYDAKVTSQLIDRANSLRAVLIGNAAPPIVLADTAGKLYDLYRIPNKFTVLYFWDPDCGHCREELPKLKAYYAQKKDSIDFEIFSVCSDPDLEKMKKYLRKNEIPWIAVNAAIGKTANVKKMYDALTTPLIYILDENKSIIAKKILSDQFDEFFREWAALKKKEKESGGSSN